MTLTRRTWTPSAVTARQREAIQRVAAELGSSADVELLGWKVIDPAEFLGERPEPAPEGLYIEFRYRYLNEEDGPWHRLQIGPIAG